MEPSCFQKVLEMVMPGDNLTIHVDLLQSIAMTIGLALVTVRVNCSAGQVTEILD
jgi:elongation factor Tu